jgi:nucleoside-diphosphate-sugar epimerase
VLVLVAGGAGLLGTAIAKGLLDEADRVVVADHFDDSGDGRAVKEHRAESFDKHPRAAVERADLSDAAALEDLFARHRPAAVVNAALFDPFRPDAGALMKASRNAGTGLFVHLSTGALYAPGAEPGVPAAEDEEPDAKGDIALTSKLIEERRLAELALPFVSLRLFDVVGPLFPPRRFPVEAFEAILSEEEAFLPDERWRDFVHVDDVVRAVVLVLNRRPIGATLNVGGGLAVNPRTFLALLARKAGKEPTVTALPNAAPGHPRIAKLDAAWEKLGWAPVTTLDGICESIVTARLSPLDAPPSRGTTAPSWGRPEPEEPPKPVSRRELFDLFRRPFRGGER